MNQPAAPHRPPFGADAVPDEVVPVLVSVPVDVPVPVPVPVDVLGGVPVDARRDVDEARRDEDDARRDEDDAHGDEDAGDVDARTHADPARAELGRATGILMALVPCTAETARRILNDAARAVGATPLRMAAAVVTTRARPGEADPVLERALHTGIAHARTRSSARTPALVGLVPSPVVLRRHLNHLRAVRRRVLAAPEDPALRAELEDAAYTLCVLMGRRSAHGALLAAEEVVAAHRLPAAPLPAGSLQAGPLPVRPSASGSG